MFQVGNTINKGRTPWNKGVFTRRTYINCKVCGKRKRTTMGRMAVVCSVECRSKNNIGNKYREGKRPWNKGTKGVMKANKTSFKKGKKAKNWNGFRKGHSPWNKDKKNTKVSGKNHWNWKGGTSRGYKEKYWSLEYKKWRMDVFQRDNFTCQFCGIRGVYLTAHHIKSWAKFPELRFEIDNGVVLCEECHKLTDNYKGRGKRE